MIFVRAPMGFCTVRHSMPLRCWALFFDGWEGASATIFDCDGTYLANVTLEDLDSKTVWLCLTGASDYG